MKALVIIPTYNEKDNIVDLVEQIQAHTRGYDVSILIVDSHSPDGTGEVADQISRQNSKVHVFHQTKKLGLGKAYLDGFRWALNCNCDAIVTMDADFSHDPCYIPQLLGQLGSYDFIIGSRYAPGGAVVNWPLHRRLLSRFANAYARTLIGIGLRDLTNAYQCFPHRFLRILLEPELRSTGYAFLIEFKLRFLMRHARVLEIPIIFKDRTRGESKVSKRVIFESAFRVWQFAMERRFGNRWKEQRKN